jgi:arylsulfatase A-like enzyme
MSRAVSRAATVTQRETAKGRGGDKPASAMRRIGTRVPLTCVWTRGFSALLLGALAACAPTDHAESEHRSSRPNIILVFADDHAAHAISAYGSRINETPNLDRLANEGMLFRNALVTNSICAPSRAVILTGKHSHLNGVYTNRERFDSAQLTFPKLLQQAGYQTAIIGKWHLKSEPTGFDYWDILPGQGDYYNPTFLTLGDTVRYTGYVTDIITDKVLDWLRGGRDPDKPFMLMYQHKAPHRRWEPGPAHLTLYDDVTVPEPATLFDDYEGRTRAAKEQEMTIARHLYEEDLKLVPPSQLDERQRERWTAAYGPKNAELRDAALTGDDLVRWKYQRYIKDYLRTVASVDDNLGRLLDYLDEAGIAENTVVIYSSDQGFYLGDHGWYDKRWMYEESLRMPFIVRWPGVIEAGSESVRLVQNLDFAETFLDIAGLSIPSDMQGLSLLPLLRGESPADWRDAIYYQYFEYPAVHMVRRHYGVRTERYKLIHYYEIGESELFDLEADPVELYNVYDKPEYAEVVQGLEARLRRLRAEYGVPERDPVPYPSGSDE